MNDATMYHAAEQDHTKAYLRTMETDVVVLAIYHFHQLKPSELWIGLASITAFEAMAIVRAVGLAVLCCVVTHVFRLNCIQSLTLN